MVKYPLSDGSVLLVDFNSQLASMLSIHPTLRSPSGRLLECLSYNPCFLRPNVHHPVLAAELINCVHGILMIIFGSLLSTHSTSRCSLFEIAWLVVRLPLAFLGAPRPKVFLDGRCLLYVKFINARPYATIKHYP